MSATSGTDRSDRGRAAAAAAGARGGGRREGGGGGDRGRYVRGVSTRSNVTTRLPWNMATVKMRKTEGGGTSTSASCGTALRARMRTPRTRVKLNST